MMIHSRYAAAIATYGQEYFSKIRSSRVLVVGAGGIGCEILKNLALIGFLDIELIDLDTIDVSNLNRQFLFRPEHVGKSKAEVAAEAVRKFNPEVNIVAHHGNIKEAKFCVSFFRTFTLVLNGLDNVDARKHVNRLCFAAKVPLIDAGTTGYNGQVMPIFASHTACYECAPKATQKTYPICTIRSTPDKPVHCLVWAKELFKLLFGACANDSMLFEDTSEAGSGERSTYMHLVPLPSTLLSPSSASHTTAEAIAEHAKDLLLALFRDEVEKRVKMEAHKTAKVAPVAIPAGDIEAGVARALRAAAFDSQASDTRNLRPTSAAGWTRQVMSASDAAAEFALCLFDAISAVHRSSMHSSMSKLSLEFDKDDDVAMRFVAAAANLRSRVFGIDCVSFHDAKGIAGNIIPAIATSNAIVAGIQVIQAMKVVGALPVHVTPSEPSETLNDTSESPASSSAWTTAAELCPFVWLSRAPTRRGYFLQPMRPDTPNAACYVCSTAQISLLIDLLHSTLGDVVKKVLKGKLGFNEPSIMLGSNILYEEGEDADKDLAVNLLLSLAACPGGGVRNDSVITVEDFSQNLTVNIVVRHVDHVMFKEHQDEGVRSDLFIISGSGPTIASAASATGNGNVKAGEEVGPGGEVSVEDDYEIEVIEPVPPSSSSSSSASSPSLMNAAGRRPLEHGEGGGEEDDDTQPRKRGRRE